MPKTVYFDGVPMQFADDVTDDEIVQFGDQQKQQGGVMSKVLSPMANMLRQATAYTAPVDVSTTPQIKGANYAFAGQQAVQNALAASQRSQQDRVSSQIQLRAMQAREMEAEKDRAQTLKLQKAQFDNQVKMENLKRQQEEREAKLKAERGDVVSGPGGQLTQVSYPGGGTDPAIKTLQEGTARPTPWRIQTVGDKVVAINPTTLETKDLMQVPGKDGRKIYNVGGNLYEDDGAGGVRALLPEENKDFNGAVSAIARLRDPLTGQLTENQIAVLEQQFPNANVRGLAKDPNAMAAMLKAAEAPVDNSPGILGRAANWMFGGGEQAPAPAVPVTPQAPAGQVIEFID